MWDDFFLGGGGYFPPTTFCGIQFNWLFLSAGVCETHRKEFSAKLDNTSDRHQSLTDDLDPMVQDIPGGDEPEPVPLVPEVAAVRPKRKLILDGICRWVITFLKNNGLQL